jgi:hypothetical protein
MKVTKEEVKRVIENFGDRIEVYSDATVVVSKLNKCSIKYQLSELKSEDLFVLYNGTHEEIQILLIKAQL